MSSSKAEFDSYAAKGFNRIPLMREVLADLGTPMSVYFKLARGPYSYLFESVQGGGRSGAVTPSSACRRARCCALAAMT